jgi:predicted DNA-binding transcriptional regulator YafY
VVVVTVIVDLLRRPPTVVRRAEDDDSSNAGQLLSYIWTSIGGMSGTSGRLLSLLSLLQARRDWPGHLLAERLEVSERTVRRDVDRLRELGYPVQATMGPDGGYRLKAGADLPPLLFDDEQAVALAVALQLAAATGAGIADAAWRALSTVRQVMPGRLRRRVDAVVVVGMPRAGAPQTDTAVLLAVTDAARAHEQLRFDYRPAVPDPDATADRPPRRVEPHHVLHRGGRWYLLAWDLDRNDWRTFRVDRITPRSPNGPRFAPRDVPGGDAATFVAARFRGHADPNAGDRWPCQGTVILHLPASEIAPYLTEGTFEPLGPDRCRLVMGAWSWPGLAASLARADADIEVIEPPELAQAFAELARRAADAAASHAHPATTAGRVP